MGKKESPFSSIKKRDLSTHEEGLSIVNEITPEEKTTKAPIDAIIETPVLTTAEEKPEQQSGTELLYKEKTENNLSEVLPEPVAEEVAKKEQETANEAPKDAVAALLDESEETVAKTEKQDAKSVRKVRTSRSGSKGSDPELEDRYETPRSSIEEKFSNLNVKERGKSITYYADADIYREIERIAQKTGVPRSNIINAALREILFN